MIGGGKNINCSKWKGDIDEAIADVCVKIIQEPCSYFSEADIQQMLVERLRKTKHIKSNYPTDIERGEGSTGKYKTSLLHREYGGGDGTRIDVVVFDPADVSKINNVNLRKTITTYLKPAYAIELGTEKTTNIRTHVQNDLKKLRRRSKETGYLIHFYKDPTKSKAGTPRRVKTEAKIYKQFKQVFDEKPQGNSKVKLLAILLRPCRKQKHFRGKCQIFNGELKEWDTVNVKNDNKLREAVRKQLV